MQEVRVRYPRAELARAHKSGNAFIAQRLEDEGYFVRRKRFIEDEQGELRCLSFENCAGVREECDCIWGGRIGWCEWEGAGLDLGFEMGEEGFCGGQGGPERFERVGS